MMLREFVSPLIERWNRLPLKRKLTYLQLSLTLVAFMASSIFFISATNRQRNNYIEAKLNAEYNILYENVEATLQSFNSLTALYLSLARESGPSILALAQTDLNRTMAAQDIDWIKIYQRRGANRLGEIHAGDERPLATLPVNWIQEEITERGGKLRTGFALTEGGFFLVAIGEIPETAGLPATVITMGRFFDQDDTQAMGLEPTSRMILATESVVADPLGLSPEQLSTLVPFGEGDYTLSRLHIQGRPYRILFRPLQLHRTELARVGIALPLSGGSTSSIELLAGLGSILLSFLIILLASAWFIDAVVVRDLQAMGNGVRAFAQQQELAAPDEVASLQEKINALASSFHTTRQDEIGLLAGAFDNMVAALRDLYAELESKVEARTRYLSAASEVARAATSTLDLDVLLRRSVDLIHERFGFYHASIFLVEPGSAIATLRESSSKIGGELKARGHQLAIGSRSLVGQATEQRRPLIVQDVEQEPAHLKNPLLPATRSEAVIPLLSGETIVGALDVQSIQAGDFSPEVVATLVTLADQLAVAVQNVRLFNEIVQLYEEQKRVAEQLAEADRLKSQFIANMSHELRTPLNSIIGFARLLQKGIDGPLNERQQEDITLIHNSGRHLLGLINNILDLSKLEAGKVELYLEPVDIKQIIEEVIATSQPLVANKPIVLQTALPMQLPLVHADAMRVRQILLNLFSNAIKFTEQGEITLAASLTSDNFIEVSINDTGIGIAEPDLEKLFKPFSQVDGSMTRRFEGSGLGLNISQRLVEMHGGRIWVESKPDRGSTFYFTLPLHDRSRDLIPPAARLPALIG